MQIKTYIAIFFIAIFLGKFIAMDSKILGVILDADQIAFVNLFCEQNTPEGQEEGQSLDQASLVNTTTVTVICASPFQFEIENHPIAFAQNNYQEHKYLTQSILITYQDKLYPPPKA